jgi:protein-glutamine gamma-glutamyltransferase
MVRLKTLLNALAYLVSVLGYLPLSRHLDTPALLVFPAALVIGAIWDRREEFPLKPAFTSLFTLAVFIFYASQVSRNHLTEPAVNLLVLLLAVRLLSAKRGREYLQIFALSLFALAASSLMSLGIAYLFYLAPMIVGITVGLVLLSFYIIDPEAVFEGREVRRIMKTSLILPLSSLVLMLVFFLILPRTQQPLWNFFQPAAAASGLSDRVLPGALAGGSEERRPAFRVQSPPLPPGDLYWRGVVLNHLDRHTWERKPVPHEETLVVGGEKVKQVFFPEPGPDLYVPLLDPPVELSGVHHRRDPDLVFTGRPRDRRTSYEALSKFGGRLLVEGEIDRGFYLQLPQAISPRIEAALSSLMLSGKTDGEKIAALKAFFRAQELTYTLDARLGATDPVEHFLFVSRRGYCEHFAASFALMLRMAGTPSRLVGGYYGGDYNAVGGYYLVTQDSAHLWVEALVDGREWVRLDPTSLSHNAGGAFGSGGLNWRRGILDAVDYFWNRLVITYDLQQQLELFREAGERAAPGRWRAPELRWSALWVTVAIFAALLLLRLGHSTKNREDRLLNRYLHLVRRRHGLSEIPPSLGLQELAEMVDDPACRQFSALFGGAVYRDRSLSDEEYRRCREILKRVGRGRAESGE